MENDRQNSHSMLFVKTIVQVLADVAFVFAAYYLAFLFQSRGLFMGSSQVFYTVSILVIIYIISNSIFGLYRSLWKNAGIEEIIRVVLAACISTGFSVLLLNLLGIVWVPTVYIFAGAVFITFAGAFRLSYRLLRRFVYTFSSHSYKRAMIFGAGDTGSMVIRELKEKSNFGLMPVVAVDDDSSKLGMQIHGIRVAGNRNDIVRLAEKHRVDVILYCAPAARSTDKREILKTCSETGCALRIIPGITDMIGNHIGMAEMRDIEMTDLLERPEVHLNNESVYEYVKDSCVFVTGGGGSIGSELCRQIARFSPATLVIFDIYENNAYELMIELRHRFPNVHTAVEIGTVMDEGHLEDLFSKYRPNVVFHAAAHKHVPLMENSPLEAVKNNVFGTWNMARTADKFGVKRFVLISTDKAVNPTNVMGATKRLAEYVVQYMNSISHTRFVAVRFGNVLGSNGSVIPLFKKQIEHGGPVTVTHKDVTRYFMTIPEAAQLVLQAASIAEGGEILILDMGEPVRIDDIARTLIRLSGYKPDEDIKIVYTGLRPGEKLVEELAYMNEEYTETGIPGIFICVSTISSPGEVRQNLEWLKKKAEEKADMRMCLAAILKSYNPHVTNGHDLGTGAFEKYSEEPERPSAAMQGERGKDNIFLRGLPKTFL